MSDKIRVLIAEDNAVLRHALTDLFEREPDIDVVGRAGDGVEAVRLANVWRPDVALLDIKMPRLDGIEAARAISQAQPQTRVVMLTTFDTDDLVFRAIVAGAIGYLLKGAQDSEIVDAVRDAARGHSQLSPAIARSVIDDFRRLKQPRPVVKDEAPDEPLTERESAVLEQIGAGKSNKAIAHALGLAEGTVKNYVSNILAKLHARSRTELAIRASR
jgi:DNA-binding NarL/FixJ family response regulator